MTQDNCWAVYHDMRSGEIIYEKFYCAELSVTRDGQVSVPNGIPTHGWLKDNKKILSPDEYTRWLLSLNSRGLGGK